MNANSHNSPELRVAAPADGQLIDSEAFCRLLLSRRVLRRFQTRDGEFQGLYEPVTDCRYYIEKSQLTRSMRSAHS